MRARTRGRVRWRPPFSLSPRGSVVAESPRSSRPLLPPEAVAGAGRAGALAAWNDDRRGGWLLELAAPVRAAASPGLGFGCWGCSLGGFAVASSALRTVAWLAGSPRTRPRRRRGENRAKPPTAEARRQHRARALPSADLDESRVARRPAVSSPGLWSAERLASRRLMRPSQQLALMRLMRSTERPMRPNRVLPPVPPASPSAANC